MEFTTLISVDQLKIILNDKSTVLFDCRHDLTNPDYGDKEYKRNHIVNALFADINKDLSGIKNGKNGRHPLPSPQIFAKWLGAKGVENSSQVITYDDSGGIFGARMWWMLQWLGHKNVALLDGGWQSWLRKGGEIESVSKPLQGTSFRTIIKNNHVSETYLLNNINNPEMCLIDARASSRYEGKDEKIDPVAGHIPGSINRPYEKNLNSQGFFKNKNELRFEFSQLFEIAAKKEVIHSCGSGISACHNLLAMEIAGLPNSKLFPGSWSSWISDPKRPISSGKDP